MRALLVSTYELGRQPFGLASPAAWLRRDGWDVVCVDTTKERLDEAALQGADLIAVHLPMHTATRMAGPVFARARRINPSARLCAYGLYAPLNEPWLRSLGVADVIGGEFEGELAAVARGVASNSVPVRRETRLPRLQFLRPDRTGLPPLSRYARLRMPDGRERVVGSTEASRGCKHLCRHCPVVPVYQGQFRIVATEVVLADIRAQIAAGAEHISFGDPDFFNGPAHAVHIIEALHAEHPAVSFDATIKIEHLLKHRDLLPRLAESGCAFVTSAVESLDDRVLAVLDKGHTRTDFLEAVALCRAAGLTLAPTFVTFHPWLSLHDYCDLLDTIAQLDLVDHVAPIQLAIRLLVPEGSRLLELPEVRERLGAFDAMTLSYPWLHGDPRVDALHAAVTQVVGTRLTTDRRAVFNEIRILAHERAGLPPPALVEAGAAATVPYLNEPWYCCAEPNQDDMRLI
jgi:hypothetical protein